MRRANGIAWRQPLDASWARRDRRADMFGRSKRKKSDFSQEIEAHLALEVDRLRAEGMPEEEAQATARREFGNVLRANERFHESGRWMWLEHLLRDIKFAF